MAKHQTGDGRRRETPGLQAGALLPGLEQLVSHSDRLLQPLALRGCASKEAAMDLGHISWQLVEATGSRARLKSSTIGSGVDCSVR